MVHIVGIDVNHGEALPCVIVTGSFNGYQWSLSCLKGQAKQILMYLNARPTFGISFPPSEMPAWASSIIIRERSVRTEKDHALVRQALETTLLLFLRCYIHQLAAFYLKFWVQLVQRLRHKLTLFLLRVAASHINAITLDDDGHYVTEGPTLQLICLTNVM